MAKWANASLLDGGSDLIRTLAGTAARVKQHLIKTYTAGDSYATVVTTNGLGSVDMVAADFVQSGAAGATRTTTIGAKSIPLTASSGAGPNLHIALVDSVSSAVLLVTDVAAAQKKSPAFEKLSAQTKFTRTWGDCYGYVLAATGRAEIMVDPHMNPWDCAPFPPIFDLPSRRPN